MASSEYRELVKQYKQAAKEKFQTSRELRKKRYTDGASWQERKGARKNERGLIKAWKADIKQLENKNERRSQKKGYKTYKKLQSRPWRIGIPAAILLVLIVLFSRWYYVATRPLNSEQQAAREQSLVLARQVAAEGAVLLHNEDNLLPLDKGAINLFGAGAASMVLGGGGAGGVAPTNSLGLYEAFGDNGLDYNKDLYNLYSNYVFKNKASTKDYKKPGKSLLDTLLPSIAGFLASAAQEMPADQIPDDVMKQAVDYSDTAVYVISRVGTETKDLSADDLRLSGDERDTLEKLNDNFNNVVVLLNTTNPVEVGFVNDFKQIQAVLWMGAPGEVGADSIAKLLTGEVNPSGRLTDTYSYNIEDNPAVVNTGSFAYKGIDKGEPKRYFINYSEGIYTGYRYFETFVDDADYTSVVQYPFGYGLSYTEFDWEVIDSAADATNISTTVRVTNRGDYAGKDVVQLYYSPPYSGDIEKSAVVLGDYAKTQLLAPGESQDVTLRFATDDMASYDDQERKAYVLEAGKYTLNIARHVHDSQDSFSYQQPADKVITASVTGATVTNQFDGIRGNADYLSRSGDTVKPEAPRDSEYELRSDIVEADYKHQVADTKEPTIGADNGIKLADLKGLDYDDPKWGQFLDQFKEKELIELAGNGGYWSIAVERLGVPKTTMYDGPASIRSFTGSWSSVAYPIPLSLASAWNDDLSQKVGAAMGDEAQSFGVNATYAPSLNLHRSPLGGRNFEYYSEDPLITGRTGASVVKGLQSSGTVAIIKHFAANDQETHRADYGLYTWMTEQSLRELYLKPFQLAVEDGNAHGVMSAFNRIGTTWAGGDKALLTNVLRGEWGFEGFVITDAGVAGQGAHFDALQAVESGNDLMLAFLFDAPGSNGFEKQLKRYLKEDRSGTLVALRSAAHNICYYVLQTTAVQD